MAQFNKTLSNNSRYRLELVVNYNAYSIPNNTTPVPWTLRVRKLSGSGYWASGSFPWSVNIGGVTSSGSISSYDFRNYTVLNLGSGTATITHDADGKKKINVSGSFTGASTLGSATASGQIDLPTIPRASQPTLNYSSRALGQTVRITTNRAHSSFTHTLQYRIGSGNWINIATGVTTYHDWTLPNSIASSFPSTTSGNVVIRVITYNGNSNLGNRSVNLTATIPNNATFRPIVSISSITEGASGLSGFTVFVQGKSRLRVQSSATGKYSSSIREYRVTFDGTHYYGSNILTALAEKSGTFAVTVRATDSRGYSSSVSENVTIQAYFPPEINSFTVERYPDSDSTNLRAIFQFNVAPLSDENNKNYRLEYRRSDQTSWSLLSTSSDEYSGSITRNHNGVLNTDYSYEIRLQVSDSFVTAERTESVMPAFELINYNASGRGWATGKVSENPNAFEVGMELKAFDKIIDKNENEVIGLGGALENGTLSNTEVKLGESTLIIEALTSLGIDFPIEWGDNYTKWNSGKLEQIKTAVVDIPSGTAWGNLYYHDFSIGNWEIPFASITHAKENVRNNTYWSNIAAYSTTSTGTIRVFRPTSGEGTGITITVKGVGRWK